MTTKKSLDTKKVTKTIAKKATPVKKVAKKEILNGSFLSSN